MTALRAVNVRCSVLGTVFLLLLLLLERPFPSIGKGAGRMLTAHHAGFNPTAVILAVRGAVQMMGIFLAPGVNVANSGVAACENGCTYNRGRSSCL